MTLDEAISHAEEMAKLKERDAERWNWHAKIWSGENRNHAIKRVNECTKCSEEHYQLSEWLRELKQLREQLREQPEIIRCGECKNMEVDSIFHDCWCNGKKVWITHYCGYAERRTDETDN